VSPQRSTPPGAGLAVAGRGRAVMRQLSEQWRTPRGLGPPLLRQALVVGRDSAAQTFTIDLGGDDPDLPMPVPGCNRLPPYVPRMGDVVWAWQNASDFLLVGATGNVNGLPLGLPGARIRATNTQATTSSASAKFLFTAGAVDWEYERDENGLGCADLAGSQLVCRYPGLYALGMRGGGPAGSTRRVIRLRKNGADTEQYLFQPGGSSWQSGPMERPEPLAVGDVLELFIQTPDDAGGGPSFGGAAVGTGMELWMNLKP
jgi:hypothetical protein